MITLLTLATLPALYGLYILLIKKTETRTGILEAYGILWLFVAVAILIYTLFMLIVTYLP